MWTIKNWLRLLVTTTAFGQSFERQFGIISQIRQWAMVVFFVIGLKQKCFPLVGL